MQKILEGLLVDLVHIFQSVFAWSGLNPLHFLQMLTKPIDNNNARLSPVNN